jgi:hypothetical protein
MHGGCGVSSRARAMNMGGGVQHRLTSPRMHNGDKMRSRRKDWT